MADRRFTLADERPHAPGADPDWEESWYFDFADDNGELAGYVRLGLRPADGRAWWWAAAVGNEIPFVLVRDHDIELPRIAGSLEIRGSGLWAEPVCEEPFSHWSVGLEAFGVAFDDPTDAYGDERGDPTALGLDLGWEDAAGSPEAGAQPGAEEDRYARCCVVHGDVLVGRRRFAVSGTGVREHVWGRRAWWSASSSWRGGRPGADVQVDGRGLVAASATLQPIAHAPLRVPTPDGLGPASRLARALCRFDGGVAWAEVLSPPASPTGGGGAGPRAGA